MPKKLEYPKTSMCAVVKLEHFYSVMCIYDIKKECVKYFQVQRDRKKITNYQQMETAIRRMMAEANYELKNYFK